MKLKFKTIVVDPPWRINKRIGKGGRRTRETSVPYEMMTLTQIKAFPVKKFAADACHLYLWATRKMFREGVAVEVARAWGFEPKGELIWGLENPGTGAGFLGNGHEPILLASRGGLGWPTGVLPGSVYFWKQLYGIDPATRVPMKIHSAKPEAFLDCVEEWSPGPYLEMFARRNRLMWSTWGDESLEHIEVTA